MGEEIKTRVGAVDHQVKQIFLKTIKCWPMQLRCSKWLHHRDKAFRNVCSGSLRLDEIKT